MFEGQDYTDAKRPAAPEPLFIAPPQRERKTQGYDVNKYFASVLSTGGGGGGRKAGAAREFKPVQRWDFQFFDTERLQELERRVFEAETRLRRLRLRHRLSGLGGEDRGERLRVLKALCLLGGEGAEEARSEAEVVAGELAAGLGSGRGRGRKKGSVEGEEDAEEDDDDDEEAVDARLREEAEFPSAEETEELARLRGEGFGDWRRADLTRFVSACAEHGRDAVAAIAEAVEGKDAAEVRRYHAVFWRRVGELKEGEKLVRAVEKGEAALRRRAEVHELLTGALRAGPGHIARVRAGTVFTGAEDHALLSAVRHHGYGRWEAVQRDLHGNRYLSCDLFMRTRPAAELKARADTLIRGLEKAAEGGDGGPKAAKAAEAGADGKTSSAGASGGGAAKKTAKKKPAASSGGGRKRGRVEASGAAEEEAKARESAARAHRAEGKRQRKQE